MYCKHRFFKCNHCGNVAGLIKNKGVPMMCCGEKMIELLPNTTEASVEKHLPTVEFDKGVLTVKVGSIFHPMDDAHNINFIYVESKHGGQRKCLGVGTQPVAKFSFIEDTPIAIFAYCNLHGLWLTELKEE